MGKVKILGRIPALFLFFPYSLIGQCAFFSKDNFELCWNSIRVLLFLRIINLVNGTTIHQSPNI